MKPVTLPVIGTKLVFAVITVPVTVEGVEAPGVPSIVPPIITIETNRNSASGC